MKLSVADQKTFPHLAAYVKGQFPQLFHNRVIVNGLAKYGSLTQSQIFQCLLWGTLPEIKIVELRRISCKAGDAGPDLYGCTRNAQNIEIAQLHVENFEVNAAKGIDNANAYGKLVYVVGATLLHETCHWGNRLNSVAETQEMGLAFEKAVYGKTIW